MNPRTFLEVRVRPEKLRVAASHHGLGTNAAIADALGLHKSTLSRLLNGKATPSTQVIARVLGHLGVEFDEVFEISDRPKVAA